MKRHLKILIWVPLLVAVFLAGRWNWSGRTSDGKQAGTRLVLYYICPMHPQYRSDHPGEAPCCGMRLEPVYADGPSSGSEKAFPAGTVRISPEKQQLIGVRFAAAEVTSGTQTVRAVGRVAYDSSSSVVVADVLEHQASRVEVGQSGLVWVPFHPEQTFRAKVDYVYPRLDSTTRTLKVRLSGGDTGLHLLPDTFVYVDLRIPGPAALTVPADAVLNTGLRSVAFVDRGEGYLEPRKVETGRRLGDRIEIRSGLMRGERVATSGNFLIDSESQLRLAAAATSPPARAAAAEEFRDPVCGMPLDPSKAAGRSDYSGVKYYFCTSECKQKFDRSPESYIKGDLSSAARQPAMAATKPQEAVVEDMEEKTPQPEVKSADRGSKIHKDPICGKQIEEGNAYRRTIEFRDVKLYFCSEDCFREFMRNPELYGQRAVPPQNMQEVIPITPDTSRPEAPPPEKKTKG